MRKWMFKFFVWRISIKLERLDAEDRVKFLANELVTAVQQSGKSIMHPSIDKGFGTININAHRLDKQDPVMMIENVSNQWNIMAKPTFKVEVIK